MNILKIFELFFIIHLLPKTKKIPNSNLNFYINFFCKIIWKKIHKKINFNNYCNDYYFKSLILAI